MYTTVGRRQQIEGEMNMGGTTGECIPGGQERMFLKNCFILVDFPVILFFFAISSSSPISSLLLHRPWQQPRETSVLIGNLLKDF
jgi:hypothetical protein